MGFTLLVSQALLADGGRLLPGLPLLEDSRHPRDDGGCLSVQLAVIQLLLGDALFDPTPRADDGTSADEDRAELSRRRERMRRDLAQVGRAVRSLPAAAVEVAPAVPRSRRVPLQTALRLLPREWRTASALARDVGDEALSAWARRRAAAYAKIGP